jgi:membrane protein DedA with SNARE-associated domain
LAAQGQAKPCFGERLDDYSGKEVKGRKPGDVLKVHRLISKSAKRSTMIGLGIGAASGPGEPNEYGFGVLIVGTIGAGVGALAGYLVGSRKHRALIYETM